jgi:hypothetical protein
MENPYGSTPYYWGFCSDYLVVDDGAKGGEFNTKALFVAPCSKIDPACATSSFQVSCDD